MPFKDKEYLRSILFGTEDSLISTTGFLAGISVGSNNQQLILMSGLIAILIEGVSMGVGEYLSDDTMEELDKLKRHPDRPLISGILLFVSYVLVGLIPLLPAAFLSFPLSIIVSVSLSLTFLFLIGFLKGSILKSSPFINGFKILFIGGITTIFGTLIGLFFKY